MFKLKVTTVGNSVGVVLPKEVLAKMQVQKGDSLYLTETANGFEISPYDPDFEQEMTIAKQVMKQYRNALRELAK
jgi:putative addiction module antidote